ncbi:nucleotidyltransferase family protein [Paenibacillus kyungheensis]|uniref:Nucleotidyltransferase family protein n=1 Tax=Paenibacillus kyungheensis TaxID=1452732 RepID=A0AAX3LXQ8_9BACL|nr:nucleotidyltransferase family protein [Paenibacillus kyungheensis]WCT54679.1 nucleotidyltransferase family protein [Paenibacillus kyungheensis]
MPVPHSDHEQMIHQIIIEWITADCWMMEILRNVRDLGLPDSWVCAGFVRSKIWDQLHQIEPRTPLSDIDVVYYDASDLDEEIEKVWEQELSRIQPQLPWSVKNEARMHIANRIAPYHSTVDAISCFPETATALGIRLDEQDQLILVAPCGLRDVFEMKIRVNPRFLQSRGDIHIYQQRVQQKNWQQIWNRLTIIDSPTL